MLCKNLRNVCEQINLFLKKKPFAMLETVLNFISKLLEVLKTDFKKTEYINKGRYYLKRKFKRFRNYSPIIYILFETKDIHL